MSLPLQIIKSNGEVPRLKKHLLNTEVVAGLDGYMNKGDRVEDSQCRGSILIFKRLQCCETNEPASFLFCVTGTNYTSKVKHFSSNGKLYDISRQGIFPLHWLFSFYNTFWHFHWTHQFKSKSTTVFKQDGVFHPNADDLTWPICSAFSLSLQGRSQVSHQEDWMRQSPFSGFHFKSLTRLDLVPNLPEITTIIGNGNYPDRAWMWMYNSSLPFWNSNVSYSTCEGHSSK